MAYRADIEIAVRGAQELKRLQGEISATSKLVEGLNNYLENIGSGGVVRSLNNLKSTVADAAEAFNKAALGTEEATIAAHKYIDATNALNAGLKERQALLKSINDEQRKERLAAIGKSVGGRPSGGYAGPIGPVAASPIGALVGQKSPVEEKIRRTIAANKEQLVLEQALLALEEKSAATANKELEARANIARLSAQGINAAKFAALQQATPLALPAFQERGLQILNNSVKANESQLRIEQELNGQRARGVRYLEKQSAEEARQVQLGILGQRTNKLPGTATAQGFQFPSAGPIDLRRGGASMLPGSQMAARAGLGAFGKRLPGAISGGIIGGAFPLLFGQSGGAAVGGAIGGLAGGLLGPGGSFAGSLLGTLLGDIASQGQKIKQLGTDIGFSAQQANVLAEGFKKANTDIEKFTAVVQNIRGLGLELKDQAALIQVVTNLTDKYGGSFDKVGNAITSALESGRVSQATLNQLTSQGINIQDALATKLGVSRDALLEMAKKGKISLQTLVDTLVEVGNAGATAAAKPKTGFDKLSQAAKNLGTAFSDLGGAIVKNLTPVLNWLAERLAGLVSLAAQVIQGIAKALSGGSALDVKASALAGKATLEKFPELKQRLSGSKSPLISGGTLTAGGIAALNPAERKFFEAQVTKTTTGLQTQQTKVTGVDVSALGQAPPSPEPKGPKGKSGESEAKRLRNLVLNQQAITAELKNQYTYSEKIFAAEMAKDPQLARRLEGEQQLKDWGVETVKLLQKEKTEAGQLAIAKAQQAKQAVIRQKTEQDLARLEKQRLETVRNTIGGLQNELDIKNATTQAERDRLRIAYEMKQLKEGGGYTDPELARIQQLKTQLATPTLGADLIKQQIGGLSDEMVKLVDVGYQVTQAAESIGSAFGNSFKGVISGAMTAQEALASFFQSVADRFLDMAAQIIAKWIEMTILNSVLSLFPGGGGGGMAGLFGAGAPAAVAGGGIFSGAGPYQFRATGGSVMGGTPYMVGEKGPELFVPGRSGTIVPNNQLGGGTATNVVVNVDASGSNVQGNGQEANQLGKAIGIAVQQELIKQKRPGGLLA